MRLTLTRRGGFAGIRPPPLVVDTAELPRQLAGTLEQLIAKTDFSKAKSKTSTPAQPDRFSYTLTIDDQTHTIDEATASPEHLNVVEAVKRAAKK